MHFLLFRSVMGLAMDVASNTVQLILQDGALALATYKVGRGVEVWKAGQHCGTISQTEVRGFAKYSQPERIISMVEALLGEPGLRATSKASLSGAAESWFLAAYL
jgi:hypothetical protein